MTEWGKGDKFSIVQLTYKTRNKSQSKFDKELVTAIWRLAATFVSL